MRKQRCLRLKTGSVQDCAQGVSMDLYTVSFLSKTSITGLLVQAKNTGPNPPPKEMKSLFTSPSIRDRLTH